MATNVAIRGTSGRGFRVANAAGTIVTIKEGVAAEVDLDNKTTRQILSREKDNFVRVATTGTTTAFFKGLSRRGFRMQPAGGTVTISNAAPGVVTFTAHGLNANDAVVFTSSGNDLPEPLDVNVVYYVKTVATVNTFTLSETPGGTVIDTTDAGSGTHTIHPVTKNVVQGGAVKVDLTNGSALRTLKRQKRDFIRVAAAANDKVNVHGLTDGLSFHTDDAEHTMAFAGANNDLTFKLKDGAPAATTVELEAVRDTTPISVDVTLDAITVGLVADDGTQATANVNPAGINNGITFTATKTGAADGAAGDTYTIGYAAVTGAGAQPLTAAVVATAITINLQVDADGSTILTTANGLVAAIDAGAGTFAPVKALVTGVADEGTGAAAVTVMAPVAFAGGVDWAVTSTAAHVKTAIEADTGTGMEFADSRVAVTFEGSGAGLVGASGPTQIEGGVKTVGAGQTVLIDLTDSFNVAQLRRRHRSWIEA